MNDKLAVKHKNSLALKENKQLRETSKSKNSDQRGRPYQLTVFCVITCCIFLCYWFILCPLLISVLHLPEKSDGYGYSHIFWLFIYWFAAFIIWLIIMLILIAIWSRLSKKYSTSLPIKSYGSDGSAALGNLKNVKHSYPENVKLNNIQDKDVLGNINSNLNKTKIVHEKETDANITDGIRYNETKKRKELSPLVIHRHNSGDNIENPGIVNVRKEADKDDKNEDSFNSPNKNSNNVNRDSIKDYLKLVTVTPLDDEVDEIKSPKGPFSPRELFFMDLIKEAEKAEREKANDNSKGTERKYFFPPDFTSTERDEIDKDAQNVDTIQIHEATSNHLDDDPTYFIANINTPVIEKTEVFLEIERDSSKEWSVDLTEEKPALNLEENSENRSPTGKVIIFEV